MICKTRRDRTGLRRVASSTNVVLQAFLLKLCSFLSIRFNSISILVSVAGFEPATLRFQGGYSTQTELHTVYSGWSDTIRTCDLRNQSPIFYQLNYAPYILFLLIDSLVVPAGIEPASPP